MFQNESTTNRKIPALEQGAGIFFVKPTRRSMSQLLQILDVEQVEFVGNTFPDEPCRV